jgi:cytosine/adenosine deaminase-related metal-dependent hydrolase
MAISLKARVVFPVDRPPIEHGVVTIDCERIVGVGKKATETTLIDLGEVALFPGLVNAHTHLEFSHLQRPLGHAGMPLVEWIRLVIQERGRADYAPADSIQAGLNETLRSGVTTVGDVAAQDDALPETGFDLTTFTEVIAFSRARADSALASVKQRLDRSVQRAAQQRIGISPHAPYTVSPHLLIQLIALARERSMPVAMHLAESADELQFLLEGTGAFQQLLDERSMWDSEAVPRGSRPLDYLRLLAGAPRALVIHGNYLDDEETAFLATYVKRMSLVYCPRTHSYFGHEPYPLAKLLAAGANVALGTDSRASNPDLDLLSEMRQVAQSHPGIEPHTILQIGTLAGARALGWADEVGSITPGKLANLVAIPLRSEPRGDIQEMLAAILWDDAGPCAVWLRGARIL